MNSQPGANLPAWWPDWQGQTAVVVASGSSAQDVPLSAARGHARLIVVKESWRLAEWADALYGSDGAWWERNGGVPAFRGLKFSASPNASRLFKDVRLVRLVSLAKVLLEKPGTVGCGSRNGNGHSGFHALNLAAQFGSRRIVLVGFDLCGSRWHNSTPDNAARMEEWCEGLDGCARQLSGLGIEVINASQVSALKNYPKMPLMAAIEG